MQLSIFLEHLLQAQEQSGKSIEEILQYTYQAGIHGLETNASFISNQAELLKKIKIQGFVFNQLYDFYSWEDLQNDEKLKNHVKAALETGAKKILFVPPYFSSSESKTIEKEMDLVMNYLAKLCNHAKDNNVTVTLEDFDNTESPCAKTQRLIQFTNKIPQLEITFDTGNFITNNEDLLESFPLLENKIVNVHCKDRTEKLGSSITGHGILPIDYIVKKLIASGYDGNFTIEHFDLEEQFDAIGKSAEFMKNLMKV